MDRVKEDLIILCERFIELADKLLKENRISVEEYEKLIKHKIEFINCFKHGMGMN